MAREKIQIDLEAKDNASAKIDKVADAAEELERQSPTVEIGADDQASDDLRGVQDLAEQVDNTSPTVDVDADTSKLEGALKNISGIIDKNIGGSLAGASSLLSGPAGIAGAAGIAGTAIFAAANNVADAAVSANALSQAVGGTVEETSRLLAATGRVGLTYNDVLELVAESNKALTENADEAERLGVNLSGTPIERFQSLVDLVYQIPDPLERSATASKFFGEEGSKQLPRLIGLYGNLTNALDAVSEREVLGQDDVDNALEFQQNLKNISGAVQGVALEFGKAVVPVANFFATALAEAEKMRTELGGDDGPLGLFESLPQLPGLTAGRKAIEDFFGLFDDGGDAARRGGEGVFEFVNAAGEMPLAAKEAADAWVAAEGDIQSAVDAGTDAMQDQADAIREADEALKGLNDTYRTSMALNGDIDRANDAFIDSLATLEEDLKEATEASRDDADAIRNRGLVVRDAMDDGIALADILADQALAQQGLTRSTADNNTVTKAQNDALLKVAQTADGPVRDALLHHIESINNIPPDVETAIRAAVAAGDLATAQTLLDDATRDRELAITPELAGEQQFENQLDHLTRERQMQIRALLSGTLPEEGGSLHLIDQETGQEKGVVPDEHTLALHVDAGDALATLAASRQAIADAEAAAREAGGEFTSALEVLEPALRDLDELFSLGAISQQTYLEHLNAHLGAYTEFSVEWIAITERIQREEERINAERVRAEEEAARERQRIAEQEAADRNRFVQGVRGGFAGAGDIVSEFAGAEGPVTGAGIASFIAQEAVNARLFKQAIDRLRGTRIHASVIEALLAAGTDALPVAQALAASSPATIQQINAALFQLFSTGNATAQSVGRLLGIPGFQTGGIFHAPSPGGAGLAVLHDGEQVIPKGKTGGNTFQTITINARQDVGTTIDQVRRYQRRNGEIRVS